MASTAIDALVAGFKDGGCDFVTNHPGSHSQDIFTGLGGTRVSINERVAFEMAYGACLSGRRSLATMKGVGVNACADPFLHAMLSGVQGGLVIVVSDDTQVTGSQERQDSRHYVDFFGGLWLEPSTTQMAYDMAYDSFALSEELDIPIVIRLTNQYFDQDDDYRQKRSVKGERTIAKDASKLIVYPTYWHDQWRNLHRKRKNVERYVENYYAEQVQTSTNERGVVVVGACTQEVEQGNYTDYSMININTYPLPRDLLVNFALKQSKIVVLEQGDPYAAQQIEAMLSKLPATLEIESNTGAIPDLSHRWITWSYTEKLFRGLASINPSFVVGDVGQYTVETTSSIDACLCFGSAIGTTTGISLSDIRYPFCVVGDGAFLHSNTTALIEARARGAQFGIIVIDNGQLAATGGQPPIADIRTVMGDVPSLSVDYADTTKEQFAEYLEEMRNTDKLSILLVSVRDWGKG